MGKGRDKQTKKSVDHSIPPVQYTVNGNTKYGEFRSVANVKGGTQEKMPNCGLPRQGDIYLSLGETNKIKFQYSLEHAGVNRDFVSVAGQCWGIKFELGHQTDHCGMNVCTIGLHPTCAK